MAGPEDNVRTVPLIKDVLSEPVPEPLPQRDEAERCDSLDSGRRCVLPLAHQSAHVYPPV